MTQEIKPTYVIFEQAKWLKEKGFDVKCKNYYLERDKELHEGFDHEYWGDYRCINWNADVIGIKPFDGFSSAPEQHVVVEWLRVNHGIWVWVRPYKDHAADNNDPIQHQMNVYKRGVTVSKEFNSHEEAYSAAFDYIKDNNLI